MLLKQSTARNVMVLMVDSTDHVSGKTGLTLTITASKDGGAFASITPTVTERGDGWYSLALTTAHTDTLGDFALHITGTGADATDRSWMVVAQIPGDTITANVTQINGGATTGNNATLSLKAISIVNTTGAALTLENSQVSSTSPVVRVNASGIGQTASGAIHVTASPSSNQTAIAIAGAGSGSGASIAGGASGHGLSLSAGGSGTGSGLSATGNSTGAGITAQGGASGDGISATSGASAGHGMDLTSQATGTHGLNATGAGSGNGIKAQGGGSGIGLRAVGGASGGGASFEGGASTGTGLNILGGGNANGLVAASAGVGNDIVADITGNVSGSVGSVTGNINTAAGTIQTLDALDTAQDTQHAATQAAIPTAAANADAVWDEARAGHVGAGSFGEGVASVQGNVTGSVASVTGAVGSVTGAVGSVTGAVGSVTGNVGGNVTGSVGSLATQAKADVNAEVLDVLNVDTFAEPGQETPAATNTLIKKLGYLFKWARNKQDFNKTTGVHNFYSDDGTTVDQKSTDSDDATTYTKGEIGTGP